MTIFEVLSIIGATLGFTFMVVVPFIVKILGRLQRLETVQTALMDPEQGLRAEMTRQHTELGGMLETWRTEAREDRRQVFNELGNLKEGQARIRGELGAMDRLAEAILKQQGGN